MVVRAGLGLDGLSLLLSCEIRVEVLVIKRRLEKTACSEEVGGDS